MLTRDSTRLAVPRGAFRLSPSTGGRPSHLLASRPCVRCPPTRRASAAGLTGHDHPARILLHSRRPARRSPGAIGGRCAPREPEHGAGGGRRRGGPMSTCARSVAKAFPVDRTPDSRLYERREFTGRRRMSHIRTGGGRRAAARGRPVHRVCHVVDSDNFLFTFGFPGLIALSGSGSSARICSSGGSANIDNPPNEDQETWTYSKRGSANGSRL